MKAIATPGPVWKFWNTVRRKARPAMWWRHRSTAGQQEDRGEVVDAEDRHQDPADVGRSRDHRQGDVRELLPPARTVDSGGLVDVVVHRLAGRPAIIIIMNGKLIQTLKTQTVICRQLGIGQEEDVAESQASASDRQRAVGGGDQPVPGGRGNDDRHHPRQQQQDLEDRSCRGPWSAAEGRVPDRHPTAEHADHGEDHSEAGRLPEPRVCQYVDVVGQADERALMSINDAVGGPTALRRTASG